MSRTRSLLAVLIVLSLFAALVPAAALAGGSSAGDNQYVDPLSGVHSHGGNSSSSTSSSSAGTSATAATSATTTSPTATAGTTTAASGKAKTLPFTGFNDWQAAGLGGLLLVGGLGLRGLGPRRRGRT